MAATAEGNKALEKAMTWSMEEVCDVFKSIRLPQYCEVLQTENITGFLLVDLFLNSGLGDLGLSALHQARLKQYFHTMNEAIAKESEATPANESPRKEAPPGEPHESPKKEAESKGDADAKDKPKADPETKEDAAAAGAAKPAAAEVGEALPRETAPANDQPGRSLPGEEAVAQRMAEPAEPPQDVVKDKKFDMLLFEAVQADDEQEVCTLLAKRANPNATNAAGEFPLLDGVMFGSHCIVAMLVFSKANLQKCTAAGITALDVCNKKDTVMTELLTRPVSDMALDSPYAQYHRSDEWREARHHFINARNYIHGTRTRLQHYVGPGIPEALPVEEPPTLEALPGHSEFNRWMRMIENK